MAKKKITKRHRVQNLNEDELKQVESMAGLGLTMSEICILLDISERELEYSTKKSDALNSAIKRGRAAAKGKMSQSAWEMAYKNKNIPMTMFWLRCRAGWTEKQKVDVEHSVKPLKYEDLIRRIKGEVDITPKKEIE